MGQNIVNGQKKTCDWLIVGGGIVGLSIAKSLKKSFPSQSIIIIEKESQIGAHASGRNSGVLHAGIYYPPHTLKARLCVEGRRLMTEYCDEKGLKIAKIGKIIIPTSPEEESEVKNLYSNAENNRVRVELIDGDAVRKLEPDAFSNCSTALLSLDTAVVSPKEILAQLEADLKQLGVQFLFDSIVNPEAINPDNKSVAVNGTLISYGYFINAAGTFADRVAHRFQVGMEYQIFPFRGSYYQLNPSSKIKIKRNIYPVPDKKVPFLGVHFTPSAYGDIFIGPTAFPAFGREHYKGIEGIDFSCTFSTMKPLAALYLSNRQGFRNLVNSEMKRLFKFNFLSSAQKLIPSIKDEDIIPCKKRGIRAQLYDRSKKEIVMDFAVKSAPNSLHILNAISPAFTCGLSFADYLVKEFLSKDSTEIKQQHI
jgi:L-2-hydroxyglutarate oxidase